MGDRPASGRTLESIGTVHAALPGGENFPLDPALMLGRLGKFFDLGFAPEAASADVPLMLGKKGPSQRERLLWELAAWSLLTCGIFLRKALAPLELSWSRAGLTPAALTASAVIALAIFPAFMKWFNKRRPTVSLEHFATPFAFGFFLDLAKVAALKVFPSWNA